KNGTNISGATESSLTLTTVTANDAGSYTVGVTNSAGSVLSDAATLTVSAAGGGAPLILKQPVSQTVIAGANVTFSVTATGSSPLSYQWQFKSQVIDGATRAALHLANVQASQAGSYSVTVSNVAGTVVSSNAVLTVTASASATVPQGTFNGLFFDTNGVSA